jgi:hypothetical protein
MARAPNYRLAKIHRAYRVDEVARLFRVHSNTVRQWLKAGLRTVDSGRPTLIHGTDLRAFHQDRRRRRKSPCQPGEIYCVRCRAPRRPAEDLVECLHQSDRVGSLVGICPQCEGVIYRRVSLRRLAEALGPLRLSTDGAAHIGGTSDSIVNSDFGG